MSEIEIKKCKEEIDNLSHEEMCKLWRFIPAGQNLCPSNKENNMEVEEYFIKKFHSLGGFTPEISKKIGWRF